MVAQYTLRGPVLCLAGNVLLAASAEAPHTFCAKVSDFGMARSMDVATRIDTRTYGAPATQQGHGQAWLRLPALPCASAESCKKFPLRGAQVHLGG